MSSPFYFLYQRDSKESRWDIATAENRESIVATLRPAFSTALDLSAIPDDGDWSKVRYRGAYYVDFDDEDDVENAATQLKVFLGKMDDELGFDVTQASFFATGSKGFHVEIPQACFIARPPATGTPWLPYIYRGMSESLMVDTLDLKVYTGKRGRMWRTPNVVRENGCYKVPLTLDEVFGMTGDLYRAIIKEPRELMVPTPASLNAKFAMLFDRAKDKITTQMRGKKKRLDKANEILDPWKKAKKHPPTLERIMNGDGLAPGVGFQNIAMQLAIYATSVGMPLPEFLDRCKGVCEKHVSDSRRYNTVQKRRDELTRMYEYMENDSLYDFDVGPVARLLAPGTSVADLGVMDTEDRGDQAPAATKKVVEDDGTEVEIEQEDAHKGVRKGFFMNAQGMWKKNGDNTESICRATLRNVESFYAVEKMEFKGYEFDLVVGGKKVSRQLATSDIFTSAAKLRTFFVSHQLSFQGGEPETMALLDIMTEKAAKNGKVFVYPREGFFILDNPLLTKPTPVKVFLSKDTFKCSLKEDDENYFQLRYKPTQVTSAYDVDIHWAPELDESHIPRLHDLFAMNKPEVLADLIGWFVAAHYRSVYHRGFGQFPLLQVYGASGSGKTQTVKLLSHLHWYSSERVSIKSATACTAYALDAHASSSTSVPFVIDEYKPRELKKQPSGKYEKLKDVLKQAYVMGDIAMRGTVNKGAESSMGLLKSKCTAPIAFMGEAIEMETAIIERSVNVGVSKNFHTAEREAAFLRLQKEPEALSALGRAIVEMGFAIDLKAMQSEVEAIRDKIEEGMPAFNDEVRKRAAPRIIFNRAVILHALKTLRYILAKKFGNEFDADIDALLQSRGQNTIDDDKVVQIHSMSEISKVISRIALLSRARDEPYEVKYGKDYIVGEGWVEVKLERAYDCYRRYCSSISDTPLFDNLDSFNHAMLTFSPVVDKVCASSQLREDDTSETIVRFDLRKLSREGVQSFRM